MARPELAERRPTWPVTLRLEPLGDEDVDELIPERIPASCASKIARAAGGNPLFIEEMLAMAAEAEGDVVVPPTLQALLGARLDQLDPAERSVLERGAIEGEIFHRGAVQALAPEETQVTPRLAALVRKDADPPRHGRSSRARMPSASATCYPRRGLRRAAEGDPRRPPRALRSLAGAARRRARRAGRDPRLPPRAGLPLPRRARHARRRHPGRRGAAAPDRRRPPRRSPAGLRRRRQPVRTRCRARSSGGA